MTETNKNIYVLDKEKKDTAGKMADDIDEFLELIRLKFD